MVAGAFPIAKLAALAFRQASKPLANILKNRAKSSPFFRNYVCMPPAQFYHWCEVNIKMRMLNLGKPTDVPKLKEDKAIELGAELLGEAIIFTCAALTILAEYMRQSRNERIKEEEKEERKLKIEREIENLSLIVSRQEAELRHISRMLGAKGRFDPPAKKENSTQAETTSRVVSAAEEVKSILSK